MPGQPTSLFFFSTGTGKIELAKVVALQLFDDERLILKLYGFALNSMYGPNVYGRI